MLQKVLVSLFLKNKTQLALEAFDNITLKTVEIIRKGRSSPKKRHL
jgi:hypothetical protein